MGDIVPFKKNCETNTVADIIQQIVDNGVTELTVMGYDKDGKEFFTGTISDGGEIAWLLLRLQNKLLLGL
jgi:hypothetical protein